MPKVLVLLDRDLAYEPRLKFRAVALWSSDTDLTFHAPREDGYVSQSAINLYGTAPDFRAPARSIASLMAELGHDHLDLLKISAEGAEYEILDHMLASEIDVRVLCVEYAQPAPSDAALASVRALERAGYLLVGTSTRVWNWKLTFVRPQASLHDRARKS